MLPDDIYSAARKRAIDEELFSSDSDTASTLTPAPETDDEYRPSSPRQASPVSPPSPLATPTPSSVNQKVTEDDLRAMALYMVEKRDVWAQYKTRSHRWEEFSRRKEVSRAAADTVRSGLNAGCGCRISNGGPTAAGAMSNGVTQLVRWTSAVINGRCTANSYLTRDSEVV